MMGEAEFWGILEKSRAAVDAAALHSILHDHRRIVEFDGRIDMKLLANHRCDALVHELTGGTFIVPQIDSANGPAVLLRMQELFSDQTGHVAEFWSGLFKRRESDRR